MEPDKKIISFEITNELKEKLRAEAYLNKKSISDMIRTILNKYFERRGE